MAKKDIEKRVRQRIKEENAKFKSKFFPTDDTVVEFTWGTDALITGCIAGTDTILSRSATNKLLTEEQIKDYRKSNNKQTWEKIAKNISNAAKRTGTLGKVGFTKVKPGDNLTGSPMYQINFSDIRLPRPKTWSMLFLIPGPANTGTKTLDILYENITVEMWDMFQQESSSLFVQGNVPAGNTTLPSAGKKKSPQKLYSTLRREVQREHDKASTTALQTIEGLKDSKLGFDAGLKLKEHKLYDQVVKALGVKLLQNKIKRRAGKYKVNNVISIFLGPNPNFGPTDIGNVRKEYIKAVNKALVGNPNLVSPKKSMSDPDTDLMRDDVIKDAIDRLVKKPKRKTNLKRKVKSKAKAFKDGERTIELIKPQKIAKTKSTAFNINIKGKLPSKRNTQSGKEEKAMSLTAIRGKINRSLSAEVRRNMGRPALINRTSTFSNSVVLNSLRKGPKSIIGDYTYQLNPYQTFENTGQRQWPQGYNPKPLIAKSIRNLATKYTEDKFILRRV